jgi:hypothetical protein
MAEISIYVQLIDSDGNSALINKEENICILLPYTYTESGKLSNNTIINQLNCEDHQNIIIAISELNDGQANRHGEVAGSMLVIQLLANKELFDEVTLLSKHYKSVLGLVYNNETELNNIDADLDADLNFINDPSKKSSTKFAEKSKNLIAKKKVIDALYTNYDPAALKKSYDTFTKLKDVKLIEIEKKYIQTYIDNIKVRIDKIYTKLVAFKPETTKEKCERLQTQVNNDLAVVQKYQRQRGGSVSKAVKKGSLKGGAGSKKKGSKKKTVKPVKKASKKKASKKKA